MKKLLKILAAFATLGIFGLVLALFFTSGIVDTANDFFSAIQAKQYPKAYGHLSSDFRASTSLDEFVAFLNKNALLSYKEASWANRHVTGEKGELDGSVTTESGGAIPLKLSFVKEGGSWKIYSIQKAKAGILAGDSPAGVLSGSEQIALVRESMKKFAQAVISKDFKDFHRHVSQLWQRQITVEQFNQVFKAFIDADLNLLFLENYMPVFDDIPSVSDEGVLTIKGYYPTKPSRVMFELGYIQEGLDWKLVKTNINIKPVQ